MNEEKQKRNYLKEKTKERKEEINGTKRKNKR